MIIRMRMTMKALSLMFLTLLILVVLIMSKQAEAGRAGVKIGHYRLIDAPSRRIIDGAVHPGCNGVPVVRHYYTPSSSTYEHDYADELAPGTAAVNCRSSPEKRPLEISATGTVFRPLFPPPTSDHLTTTTTVGLVSILAFIFDHSRPPTRL
ncbi:hypothetical protein PanWU01x14_044180, partial [Parasponia andersonii]